MVILIVIVHVDLSREDIESRLGAVVDAAGCRECKNILKDEYDQVLRSWSQLQVRPFYSEFCGQYVDNHQI